MIGVSARARSNSSVRISWLSVREAASKVTKCIWPNCDFVTSAITRGWTPIFRPASILFCGDNAQGKTNILEAIYLMATLRSFRGVGSAQMVRHGQKGYFVGGKIIGQGEHEVKLYWSARERNLTLDGRPVRKLTDYLGVLRTVVFCTEDLQLIKGPGAGAGVFWICCSRKRIQPTCPLLQRYTHALRSRNALLKRPILDPHALESFSRELLAAGTRSPGSEPNWSPSFPPMARLAYRRISNDAEELRIEYSRSVRNDFAVELAQSHARERAIVPRWLGRIATTCNCCVNDKSAAQFGSEGQKRTLAIALKMAQAEYLTGIHGSPPVLLIDDIMGELDVKRRSGFLPLLQRARNWLGARCL